MFGLLEIVRSRFESGLYPENRPLGCAKPTKGGARALSLLLHLALRESPEQSTGDRGEA